MSEEEQGTTTRGMSRCFQAEAIFWEGQLNTEFESALEKSQKRDAREKETWPELGRREETLREAQRAWAVFRDANCAHQHAYDGSGSMRHITTPMCQARMAADRTIQLLTIWQPYVGESEQ